MTSIVNDEPKLKFATITCATLCYKRGISCRSLSVCPCLSQVEVLSKKDGWIELVFGTAACFDSLSCTRPMLHGNLGIWIFATELCPELWTLHRFVDRRNVLSTYFDKGGRSAWQTIAVLVGRTKLAILATVDVRLGQFVTVSVYICVQHGTRGTARRAGPSAIADTCVLSCYAMCRYSTLPDFILGILLLFFLAHLFI